MSVTAGRALTPRRIPWRELDAPTRLLGVYLVAHFALLFPYAAELFSSAGMLPDARLSPLTRAFPNVLLALDSPLAVHALVGVALLASAALAVGRGSRPAALVVFYVWACLLGRNPLIRNPSIPFVGLMLITLAMEPDARAVAATETRATLRRALLVVLAIAYTYSGVTKLGSATWVQGDAFAALLENPLARETALRRALTPFPAGLGAALTYGVVALEVLYAPLSISRRLRRPLSAAMMGMHLGLIVLIDFADLSVAMLLVHLFTWEATRSSSAPMCHEVESSRQSRTAPGSA